MSRLKVTKENPETIKKFTRDLKNSVRELSESLSELFELASTNTIKGPSSKVTLDLFDQWCLNSGILPIRIGDGHRTADELFVSSIYPIYQTRTDRGHIDPKRLTRLYSRLARDSGFDTEDVENFVNEAMSAALDKDIRTEERFQEHLYRYLYQLYHDEIRKFCVQTAHVILARIILYRVLEDKEWKGRNLVPRRISGVALEEIRKEASEVAIAALGRVPHIVYLKQVEDVRSFMETLIPRIYSLATYDWWVIPEGYKSDLKRKQDDILEEKEKFLDDCVKSALYYFDRYDFSQIDRDVWKDIYQEYLPYEERQRLGGFYTPDELVELILDLVGYDPNDRDLCERTLLDPACGSGTFLVEASLRLIKHLNEPLQCHTSLKDRSEGEAARSIIEKVRDKIFGIDIHPFAQFLTIVNLSFQIIDLFVIARRQFPNLKLEFNVYSGDSLEYDFSYETLDFFNKRLEEDRKRKLELKKVNVKKFDFVVGNPPWGGVLKGRLSPLFDVTKKEHYKEHPLFDEVMMGKVDFYVPFLAKGVEWLSENGKIGFLTQNRYLSRDYGKGVRSYLPEKGDIEYIIDLGNVGSVFFPKITNYPCITVLKRTLEDDPKIKYVEVARSAKDSTKNEIVSAIKECVDRLEKESEVETYLLQAYALDPNIVRTEGKPWALTPLTSLKKKAQGIKHIRLLKAFRALQGVTPGGEGSLDIFRIYGEKVRQLDLEREIIPKAIEGRNVHKWGITWDDKYAIYPYETKTTPSIYLGNYDDVREDTFEARRRKLEGEITKGTIKYPKVANYLLEYYDRLAGREFEGKPLVDYNKKWFEYHRPREPKVMLSKPKIVSTRLFERTRFALDKEGFLPFDSCVCFFSIKSREYKALEEFVASTIKSENMDQKEMTFCYVLAILNSSIAEFLMKLGRKPARGGYYNVSESSLKEIPLPISEKKTNIVGSIVNKVRKILELGPDNALEGEIDQLVYGLFDVEEQDKVEWYLEKH